LYLGKLIEFESFGSNINQFIRQCIKEVDSSIGAAIAYNPAIENPLAIIGTGAGENQFIFAPRHCSIIEMANMNPVLK